MSGADNPDREEAEAGASPKPQPQGILPPEPWCAAVIGRHAERELTQAKYQPGQTWADREMQLAAERERAYQAILRQHDAEAAAPPEDAPRDQPGQCAAVEPGAPPAATLTAGVVPRSGYLERLARLALRTRSNVTYLELAFAIPLGLLSIVVVWQFGLAYLIADLTPWNIDTGLTASLGLVVAIGIGLVPYFIVHSIMRSSFANRYRNAYVQLQNTELPVLIGDMHLYVKSIEEPAYFPRWGKSEAGAGAALENHLRLAASYFTVLLSFIPGQAVVREQALRRSFFARYQVALAAGGLPLLSLCCLLNCGPLGCLSIPLLAASAGSTSVGYQAVLAAICDFFRGAPDLALLGLSPGARPAAAPPTTRPGVTGQSPTHLEPGKAPDPNGGSEINRDSGARDE